MAHDPNQYPKTDVGSHQKELIYRDFRMVNYHIQHDKLSWLKDVIDIIDRHHFEDDFCNNLDTEYKWDIEESPRFSGASVHTCTDMVNGVLLITTGGGDDDSFEVTQMCECWKLDDCYPLYAEIRFKLDDDEQNDFWFGFITGTTWFTAPNDYVVFHKDDGDANIDFATSIGGVAATVDTGIDLTALTWLRLGIHWDGAGTIRWFIFQDGNAPQTVLATGLVTTNIPTTELALGFGIQAGEAVAKSLYIDYIKSSQLRVIE